MNAENEWERPIGDEPFMENEPLAVIHGRGCLPGAEREEEGEGVAASGARVVARWKNAAGESSDRRFSLSLSVASMDRERPVHATFVLDTGASTTLVSPSLARILELQPGHVELASIAGVPSRGYRS